jgi:hypothetical protein
MVKIRIMFILKSNQIFSGQITEDDEKLLEEETASPANLKRYEKQLLKIVRFFKIEYLDHY